MTSAARTVRPVGLAAVGAAVGALRLTVADIAGAWGGGGRGQVAMCDADQDTLTLAWEAAVDALDAGSLDAGAVDGLWWGTSRPPFAEGPSHAFLATALGLDPAVAGALCSGSPHAGMEALLGAWDAIAAGHVDTALVVASDALIPGVGTAGETATGAGAVALVLGAPDSGGGNAPARFTARRTASLAVVDRYRGDTQEATGDVYDGRLFREEVFLPLLSQVGASLCDAMASDDAVSDDAVSDDAVSDDAVSDDAAFDAGPAPAGWAIADPDGKLGSALARRLGAPSLSAPVMSAVGDTGAAAPLLGLVHALGASDAAASTTGVIGYGGGRATAVAVEVAGPVPGAERLEGRLGGGRQVPYVEALKVRGQLEPMTDPIPMGVPPGSAAFVRGNVEMLGLLGARCAHCDTVSVPPSIHPTCTGCGGTDMTVVALSRRGRVQTFVVNQTMPAPFQAPLPLVVIDLDDGARLMLQGAPEDAATLDIGTPVALHLRRYATERGVPVYGYKAFAVAGPDGPGGNGSSIMAASVS
jgi:hydroxymethylglutaryl-CoA synthase